MAKNRSRRITIEGVLRLIDDLSEEFLPITRIAAQRRFYAPKYFNIEDYFPSEVERSIHRLLRKGVVRMVAAPGGTTVVLTEKGKRQLLIFNLDKLEPKTGKWDGKWRMVFFDVPESRRKDRELLRKYLTKLGLRSYQESVYVTPYSIDEEVKYLREVLKIPHGVKLAVVEKLENDEDLRKWFRVRN